MTKYQITFFINSTSKIIIPLKDPVESLGPIYIEKIILLFNNDRYLLSKTTLYHDMIDLRDLLKKALNKKLFLHPSISQDIGYLHNNKLHNEVDLPTCALPSDEIDWIGYLYHFWNAKKGLISLDSWIYNDAQGSIIFEATPVYPYLFSNTRYPNYIPYEEWIKTYKPYFITTLPRKTAEQWLEQAEYVIRIIENNEKRWKKEVK
jgi:hypothetical protein